MGHCQIDALRKESRELHASAAAAGASSAEALAKIGDLAARLEAAEKAGEKLTRQVKKLEREKGELPTSEALVCRKKSHCHTSDSLLFTPQNQGTCTNERRVHIYVALLPYRWSFRREQQSWRAFCELRGMRSGTSNWSWPRPSANPSPTPATSPTWLLSVLLLPKTWRMEYMHTLDC